MEIECYSSISINLQNMQTPQLDYFEEQDQDEDALSLCDFTLHHDADECGAVSISSPDDDFEFSAAATSEETQSLAPHDDGVVFFFGKSIPVIDVPTTSFWKPPCLEDPFCLKSESFDTFRGSSRRSHFSNRSSSVRLPETGNCRHGQSSRKHNRVLIGLVKFPSRMELSDIKKRQDRLSPAPMFPVAETSQPVVSAGITGSGGRGHWGCLLRPLRFRSHLLGALAKASFGCIPRA